MSRITLRILAVPRNARITSLAACSHITHEGSTVLMLFFVLSLVEVAQAGRQNSVYSGAFDGMSYHGPRVGIPRLVV